MRHGGWLTLLQHVNRRHQLEDGDLEHHLAAALHGRVYCFSFSRASRPLAFLVTTLQPASQNTVAACTRARHASGPAGCVQPAWLQQAMGQSASCSAAAARDTAAHSRHVLCDLPTKCHKTRQCAAASGGGAQHTVYCLLPTAGAAKRPASQVQSKTPAHPCIHTCRLSASLIVILLHAEEVVHRALTSGGAPRRCTFSSKPWETPVTFRSSGRETVRHTSTLGSAESLVMPFKVISRGCSTHQQEQNYES